MAYLHCLAEAIQKAYSLTQKLSLLLGAHMQACFNMILNDNNNSALTMRRHNRIG
ncbi:hypothetical protein THOG11_20045 [Vibrio harveyi]|nr:hypothetical protein TH15OA1_530350 [Vibrio harveyi]CAH1554527.1 hypothetical protein THOD03_20045 [Vibrio harveyi]CAH1561261.1 hypothetical protein THOG11_20045 [Vibrio harveyi]